MITALARQWIEERRHQITARESPRMREIVDAAHEEPEDEEDDRVLHGLTPDETAAALPAVMHERAEQTEHGGRCAHRERHADRRAEEKSAHAGDCINDDRTRR